MSLISQIHRFFSLLGILLWIHSYTYGQIIPSHRRVNWEYAGSKDIYPGTTDTLNILDFGGKKDSTGNNTVALDAAMENLNGREGVIYFPAGKYLFKGSVHIKSGVTIQGAGAQQTFFYFAAAGATSQDAFIISNSDPAVFTPAISGYITGSNYIKIMSPDAFQHASYIDILQDNGTWDTNPEGWAINTVGQIIPIESIRSDTLFLKHNLRIDYDASLHPRLRPWTAVKHVAFKCFAIQRADIPNEDVSFFSFLNATQCRIDGVVSTKSKAAHVKINCSTNITISGCYFYDAFAYDGTATRGYGITLFTRSGECLIENNIFRKLRHAVSLKEGANGNVIGYNYFTEGNRSEFPNDFTADINLHGHYAYANLIEGNIADNFFTDHTFGPAGPFNTFFRNKALGYGMAIFNSGTQITSAQNYIGNDITGNKPLPFFVFPIMNRPLALNGTDHFAYGNWEVNTVIPSATTALNDHSYYLHDQPVYWTASNSWPSIGIPFTRTGSIPAMDRYLSGQTSVCPVFPQIQSAEPLQVKVFKADKLAGKISINWEIKGAHFLKVEIQKRLENTAFQTIATSHLPTASVNDTPTVAPQIYYRLKVFDLSGNIIYSDIININNTITAIVQPFFNGQGELIIKALAIAPYTVSVYNAYGTLTAKEKSQTGDIKIHAGGWQTGLWLVNIQNASGFNQTYKVAK